MLGIEKISAEKVKTILLAVIMLSSIGGLLSFMDAFSELFGGNIPKVLAPPAFFMAIIAFFSSILFFWSLIKYFPEEIEVKDSE